MHTNAIQCTNTHTFLWHLEEATPSLDSTSLECLYAIVPGIQCWIRFTEGDASAFPWQALLDLIPWQISCHPKYLTRIKEQLSVC